MIKHPIVPSAVFWFLLISFGFAAADIAPDPMTGGRMLGHYDGESTEVRMVEETVLVRVFECEIITIAEFIMYNEKETVSMDVGFPYAYEGEFIDFRAYINGREVDTRDGKKENVGRKKSTVYWKLWNMTFEKDEAYEIRVEYKTQTYEFEHTFIWTENYISMPKNEIDEAQKLTKSGIVSYWLDTGKAWKGILDRCKVEIELVGRTDDNIMSYNPKDGNFTGSGVVWEYTDYEPAGRINIRYYPNMPVKEIPPYLLEILEQYPNDPHLASSVGSALSSDFNKRDLAFEVYHAFLARWNEPIPQLMEYASGGRCRFNFKGAGGDFYMTWRMASMLFKELEKHGTLIEAADIAPTVSRMSSAIIDSLDTCGNLPKSNASLYTNAVKLLDLSNSYIEERK